MMEQNYKYLSIRSMLHSPPALKAPFPTLTAPFTVNKIPSFEAPKVSNKMSRNSPSCFLILCFTVSPTQSSNMLLNILMILRF